MDRGPKGAGRELARFREALAAPDPAVRATTILRAPAIRGVEDLIVAALDDPVPSVRRAAVQSLGRIGGPTGVRALVEVSHADVAPAVRAEAVAVLGRILGTRWGGIDPAP